MPLIVLDPGHGGRDPGTTNNGLEEKTLVLATSLKLRDALQRCGFQVMMTRTTDTLPLANGTIGEDLTYRANLANNAQADLFVAWHIDSIDNGSVNGVAVWIYPNTRGTRTDTWAEKIVNAIAAASGQSNRGVYLGDFAVLRETNMDAMLVEAGFLTNPAEARNLADPTFQAKQAEGAARGICSIFNMPYVAPAGSTPTPAPTPTPTPVPTTQEDIPSWAAEAVQKMLEWGVMSGYEDGKFHPNDTVTRAQLASALARFYEFLTKNNGNGGA
ncbi:MAG: N-acetylmuramoyl-L-alanine amidase [Tumebacillaceae bacterium]